MEPAAPGKGKALAELALLFTRLGATAFGGPAAHIAIMEDECVKRRGWLTREEFLDLVAATNLIPGPNSTEMAIHIGYLRAGFAGLVVAGACFILPAALTTLACAWAYMEYGTLPQAQGVLYGVKAAILAVVINALWRLGRASLKGLWPVLLAAACVVASAWGVHELIVLFGAGALAACARGFERGDAKAAMLPLPLLVAQPAIAAVPFSQSALFLFFLKTGSVLFGSGYVLLAFLRADLVERYGWLTEQQLLDAIAVGQITPGPVFSTATFIGYVLGGWQGASLATLGIFLPAFVFVAISGPLVPRLRKSKFMSGFLDGVVLASLALMALVTWQLGFAAIIDWPSAAVATISAALLLRFNVNSTWLILGGALIGWAVFAVR
ncbi:MAG: chromate efflux transporter [Planctomycetes bacterium]|nr:chromate efflux transporter [Planctomycetota bacterium]